MSALGMRSFLDYSLQTASIPAGYRKVIHVDSLPGPDAATISQTALRYPGATWYVLGEPNRLAGYEARSVVGQLHDLYQAIRAADPTARITSPAVLNWDFTCNGCGGYQQGHVWVDEFRAEWAARYSGTEPDVDIWAIDAYPLDWINLPTVNAQIPISQIAGLRAYLDAIPSQRGKPILVTEISLHWGYNPPLGFGFPDCGLLPSPVGPYQTEQVKGYLRTVFDWLDANAEPMKIEGWFLYISYRDIAHCSGDAFAGLTLFDGPEPGAQLTEVGRFVRDRVDALR